MDNYKNKEGRSGCDHIVDWWEAYEGKYPDPTHEEYNLILPFLRRFALEDDDFVEDQNKRWLYFKNRIGCPNLRSLVIKFLRQVRDTKGYDVDMYFDFSMVHAWHWYHIFIPRSLDEKKFYAQAMAASKFAIRKINGHMNKRYEVVSVDKLVSTTNNILLLTFSAKEKEKEIDLEIFQAMVYALDFDADADATTPSTYQLKNWKFKPIPIDQL